MSISGRRSVDSGLFTQWNVIQQNEWLLQHRQYEWLLTV